MSIVSLENKQRTKVSLPTWVNGSTAAILHMMFKRLHSGIRAKLLKAKRSNFGNIVTHSYNRIGHR